MSSILYVYTAIFLLVAVILGCSGVHLLILAHSAGDISVMGTMALTLALVTMFAVLYAIIREAVAAGIKDARPEP